MHAGALCPDVPQRPACSRKQHFYASVLLDAGESMKALSEYLGHSDPGFALRTYTHLLPTSEQRTRQAIDRALTGTQATVDGLTTAYGRD